MASTRTSKSAADRAGAETTKALKRLEQALTNAQEAAASVRRDLGRGRKDIAAEVERLIKDARRDYAKLEKVVRKDLADVLPRARAAAKKPAAKKPAAKKPAAKKPAAKKPRKAPAAKRAASKPGR